MQTSSVTNTTIKSLPDNNSKQTNSTSLISRSAAEGSNTRSLISSIIFSPTTSSKKTVDQLLNTIAVAFASGLFNTKITGTLVSTFHDYIGNRLVHLTISKGQVYLNFESLKGSQLVSTVLSPLNLGFDKVSNPNNTVITLINSFSKGFFLDTNKITNDIEVVNKLSLITETPKWKISNLNCSETYQISYRPIQTSMSVSSAEALRCALA